MCARCRRRLCLGPVCSTTLPHAAAINDIKAELHATDQDISLSLSLFILFQGITPLLWSALSEIRGRKVPVLSPASPFHLTSRIRLSTLPP